MNKVLALVMGIFLFAGNIKAIEPNITFDDSAHDEYVQKEESMIWEKYYMAKTKAEQLFSTLKYDKEFTSDQHVELVVAYNEVSKYALQLDREDLYAWSQNNTAYAMIISFKKYGVLKKLEIADRCLKMAVYIHPNGNKKLMKAIKSNQDYVNSVLKLTNKETR
jgi:hypothetical protein